eukprot:m.269026 g.269026  ORF g.269026 m.269026 type:complete len:510 (+) comp15664_c0_seq4:237-1766(+)
MSMFVSPTVFWFHGRITKEDSERLLMRQGCKKGMFLVRAKRTLQESSAADCVLTVAHFDNAISHHLLLLNRGGVYTINGRVMSNDWKSVEDVVRGLSRTRIDWPIVLRTPIPVSIMEATVMLQAAGLTDGYFCYHAKGFRAKDITTLIMEVVYQDQVTYHSVTKTTQGLLVNGEQITQQPVHTMEELIRQLQSPSDKWPVGLSAQLYPPVWSTQLEYDGELGVPKLYSHASDLARIRPGVVSQSPAPDVLSNPLSVYSALSRGQSLTGSIFTGSDRGMATPRAETPRTKLFTDESVTARGVEVHAPKPMPHTSTATPLASSAAATTTTASQHEMTRHWSTSAYEMQPSEHVTFDLDALVDEEKQLGTTPLQSDPPSRTGTAPSSTAVSTRRKSSMRGDEYLDIEEPLDGTPFARKASNYGFEFPTATVVAVDEVEGDFFASTDAQGVWLKSPIECNTFVDTPWLKNRLTNAKDLFFTCLLHPSLRTLMSTDCSKTTTFYPCSIIQVNFF